MSMIILRPAFLVRRSSHDLDVTEEEAASKQKLPLGDTMNVSSHALERSEHFQLNKFAMSEG